MKIKILTACYLGLVNLAFDRTTVCNAELQFRRQSTNGALGSLGLGSLSDGDFGSPISDDDDDDCSPPRCYDGGDYRSVIPYGSSSGHPLEDYASYYGSSADYFLDGSYGSYGSYFQSPYPDMGFGCLFDCPIKVTTKLFAEDEEALTCSDAKEMLNTFHCMDDCKWHASFPALMMNQFCGGAKTPCNERKAWEALGYTEEFWHYGTGMIPHTWYDEWSDMERQEKIAARLLGYDKESWDDYHHVESAIKMWGDLNGPCGFGSYASYASYDFYASYDLDDFFGYHPSPSPSDYSSGWWGGSGSDYGSFSPEPGCEPDGCYYSCDTEPEDCKEFAAITGPGGCAETCPPCVKDFYSRLLGGETPCLSSDKDTKTKAACADLDENKCSKQSGCCYAVDSCYETTDPKCTDVLAAASSATGSLLVLSIAVAFAANLVV